MVNWRLNAATMTGTSSLESIGDCIDSLEDAKLLPALDGLCKYQLVTISDGAKKKQHLPLTVALTATQVCYLSFVMRLLRSETHQISFSLELNGCLVMFICMTLTPYLRIITNTL